MLLYKINGGTEDVQESTVREIWDAPNENCRKVTIELDDATRITYKVTNTIVALTAAMEAYEEVQ